MHEITDADRRFRYDVEAFAVSPAAFNHEAHVRLAYVYLAEADVESAVQRMRDALLAFLDHHNLPLAKFHETLTRSWILALRHFMNKAGSESATDFIARHPELLDAGIMLTHYSAQALFSDEARSAFVEPDLDPIPW
ncbi:MAG: hypothetical protein SH809_06330 [Rhodothermales bacterium]|nr:hypothetical protein [Rhodothermales bacterium]